MMGKTTQPIRIVATSKGENVTEFGSSRERKIVFTPNTAFEDDGTKVTKKMTAQRLSQLDVTGIYMLATGSMSETRLGQAAAASIRDTQALKVPVDRGRPPKQLAWPGETDSFDIYVGQNGLLLGIARLTTPEASSTRVTLGYTFTDYRLTNGVFLPYRIEAYLRGRLVETIEVEAYRFDIAVDPAVFKPGSAR
jgi:hypothetical protein